MRPLLPVAVVCLVVLSGVAATPAAGAVTATSDATTDRSPSTLPADSPPPTDPATDGSPTAGASAGPAADPTTTGPAASTGPGASNGSVVNSTAASSHLVCPSSGGAPSDPDSDVLGWENGCWYNESLPVTPGDGYNETELRQVLARSMARVEQIRGLEFGETPDLQLIPRDRYAERITEAYRQSITGNVTTKDRLHQNTKFEALFTVPEDESYFSDLVANQGGFAGAFYTSQGIPQFENVSAGDIVVIVPEAGQASLFRESTLGHELVHRLQDTNLGVIDTFRGGPTEEAANVNTSLTEGEATLVGQRYAQRCGEEWNCLPTPDGGAGSLLQFENPGLTVYDLGPYSETAKLFAAADERGGVDAMNAIYDDPPASTEQLLHPDAYPDDAPAEISYTDRSSDEWARQTFEDGVDYATFGEMGIFVMLWYPSLETRSRVVMGVNYPFQGVSPPSRYDFTHPASSGWDGDRMVVYTNATSAETNETGYVWKTHWDSETDAAEFAAAYTTILTEYGSAVDGRSDTYRIPESHRYGDAFYVNESGSTVTIVNAPSVADLTAVRAGAAPEATPTPTPSPTPTASPTPTPTPSPTSTEVPSSATDAPTPTATDGSGPETPDPGTETTGDGGPGFGVAVAVLALLLGALAGHGRRRQ